MQQNFYRYVIMKNRIVFQDHFPSIGRLMVVFKNLRLISGGYPYYTGKWSVFAYFFTGKEGIFQNY
jgi:hypothetical protein